MRSLAYLDVRSSEVRNSIAICHLEADSINVACGGFGFLSRGKDSLFCKLG